ncbi:MAG: hypothetical protein DIKNOCCD_02053 [bacterium]|nr:hypothetical protein [bacterium]
MSTQVDTDRLHHIDVRNPRQHSLQGVELPIHRQHQIARHLIGKIPCLQEQLGCHGRIRSGRLAHPFHIVVVAQVGRAAVKSL